jgi:RNA polymerase sigma factor (sigma-70 family)
MGLSEWEFEQAVDQYRPFLVNLAWKWLGSRELAEDVVQDGLGYLWTRLHTYDPARGSIGQWLGKCIGSRIRNARRNERRNPTVLSAQITTPWSFTSKLNNAASHPPTQESRVRVNRVLDEVGRMSGKMGEVMELWLLGLDLSEIDKAMGTKRAARKWFKKGMERLRKRVR